MATLTPVYLPHLEREFKFQTRASMRSPFVGRSAKLPRKANGTVPPTPLPVDSSGNMVGLTLPMDDNDQYGICGPAMLAHWYQILKNRQGTGIQVNVDVSALLKQYLRISGGDNGTDESQITQHYLVEGIAGIRDAVMVDALDVDMTDDALVNFCIDQFGTVQMGWSVPNAFINGFATGTVWSNPGHPNPERGHYTPIFDVASKDTPLPTVDGPTGGGRDRRSLFDRDAMTARVYKAQAHPVQHQVSGLNLAGYNRLATWAGWCWISPDFRRSVNPDGFVIFSECQFDANGLDSKGRHITTQAAAWEMIGGNPISASIMSKYPPALAPIAGTLINWSKWLLS